MTAEPATASELIIARVSEEQGKGEDKGENWEKGSEFDEAMEFSGLGRNDGDNDDKPTILAPNENNWWHKV